MLGLQPVALLDTLFVDPVLPTWLPELVLHDLRLGACHSHAAILARQLRRIARGGASQARHVPLVKQPPPSR